MVKKREEPATPTAFPQYVKTGGKKDEQAKRIDIQGCKVGTVGRKSYEAKKAESLHRNIEAMIEKHGVNRIVLCTLTFANDPKSMKVAQRRFNSIAANLLPELFSAYITAVHRGTKRGRIHYHLIAVCKEDVRSGFDFEAWNRLLAHVHLFGRHNARYRVLAAAVSSTANIALRGIWKTFRDRAEGYGFGMVETYPIRSNAEAIGRYVGSYVRVAAENRQFRDKRMRTLRYSLGKGGRVASPRFSWVNGAGLVWRAGCRLLALLLGVDDLTGYGKRWAWRLKTEITVLGRYAERMSEKLYTVAEELGELPEAKRREQVWEFCGQLAAFEKREGVHGS